MQKIWPLEVLSLIVPKKKFTKHFFYLCSSNGNPINEHLSTDTCHKSTLSPNNLMLKLIMFIEKTKHLCSRVEIKTLKKRQNNVWLSNPKGLLNPKLAATLPCGANLETLTPLPIPSPFHTWVKFLRLCCLSALQAFLLFISSLCATFAPQLLLNFLSARVGFP